MTKGNRVTDTMANFPDWKLLKLERLIGTIETAGSNSKKIKAATEINQLFGFRLNNAESIDIRFACALETNRRIENH